MDWTDGIYIPLCGTRDGDECFVILYDDGEMKAGCCLSLNLICVSGRC